MTQRTLAEIQSMNAQQLVDAINTPDHTPGPWDVHHQPLGVGSDKNQWRIIDGFNHEIADSPVGRYAFNEANARLIAAAPDLLLALQKAAQQLARMFKMQAVREDWEYPLEQVMIEAVDAITKATQSP